MIKYIVKPGGIGRKLWVVVPEPTLSDPDPKFAREFGTESEARLAAARFNALEAETARRHALKTPGHA